LISDDERALAALKSLRRELGVELDEYGDMLIKALEKKIREHPIHRWKVYNYEVYGSEKKMSVSLKRAGDALMRLSEGFITRGFDKGKGFHYVEVEK
jgi:hypothetical protein